jgi:hypothetical protein
MTKPPPLNPSLGQPRDTLLDWLLTEAGETLPDRKKLFQPKEIAIMGIGLNTVDLLVIDVPSTHSEGDQHDQTTCR